MLMRSALPMIFSIARPGRIDGINLLFRQHGLFLKVSASEPAYHVRQHGRRAVRRAPPVDL